MGGCCDPRGCDQVFGEAFARRSAARYRRRGLDRTARRLVDLLDADGAADGATVLDIGGGAGEIGLELLRRGAVSATTVELTTSYDAEARRLALEAGVGDRVHRVTADVAVAADVVQAADLVVLHRVVCCYPEPERLLAAVARLCRSRVAYSHPPRNLVSRAVLGTQNAVLALSGREFRAFAHPPGMMRQALTSRGLHQTGLQRGPIWTAEAFAR